MLTSEISQEPLKRKLPEVIQRFENNQRKWDARWCVVSSNDHYWLVPNLVIFKLFTWKAISLSWKRDVLSGNHCSRFMAGNSRKDQVDVLEFRGVVYWFIIMEGNSFSFDLFFPFAYSMNRHCFGKSLWLKFEYNQMPKKIIWTEL